MTFTSVSSITVLAALALSPIAYAHGGNLPTAQQAQPPAITTTDLGDGLYMLHGRGGNVGVLVGPDGVFVIDAQYPDMAPGILSAIDEIAGETPRYLINTHWHGDHTGGNAIIGATGATIIAHQGVRDRVTVEITRDFFGQENTTPALDEVAWPVITFNDEMRLYLNGQTIHLIHAPSGHTDGDTFIVFEEANIIHTGDLMFNGFFPFVDITSGGSFDGYIAATETISASVNTDTRIIPGHGPLATPDDLAAALEMLKGTVAAVSAEAAQDKSAEDILAAEPLALWAEAWGGGFIDAPTFTRLILGDLQRQAGEADSE